MKGNELEGSLRKIYGLEDRSLRVHFHRLIKQLEKKKPGKKTTQI